MGTTVHTSPDYSLRVGSPPPPGYPRSADPDTYALEPFARGFESRRRAFLEHVRRNPAPNNFKAAYYELVRLALGEEPHLGVLQAALDYIAARKDCADFVLHGVLRLLYQFGDHPALPVDLLARAQRTVLGFKYWPNEPGIDSMCTWTENHYILFSAAAYLAGQLFPESSFTNSGQVGRELMALNRGRILRWLDLRFRTGFSEWLSHVYYDEDLTALLNLADFCRDAVLRDRAVMVIDLLGLDMALNSFRGVFGSTHGRSYANTKKWAAQEGTTDTVKLLFGMGVFSGYDNMSAVCLALNRRYQPPAVLPAIANHLARPAVVNRQRMGLRMAEAERWGLGFEDFEDGMVYLTLEAYTHPRNIALTMRMFDAFNWWENDFFAPFKPYKSLLTFLRVTRTLGFLARALERDICRNTREEVNVYTYRTPDYLLSTAQDYRKGYGGDQQHIWQATLGPEAVCFTTHPAKLDGPAPGYWTGSGLLPRAAQVKNVVIAVYKIEKIPALYVPIRHFFTHAWLPKDKFDEVVERDGWIFARLDEGYLGLRSMQPYYWQQAPGEDQNREVIADGAENIWICELGRCALDGEFGDFVARVSGAALEFNGLNVRYTSPSQGVLQFGWDGDLRVNGQVVPLHDYPRYDNPYVRADFPARVVDVHLDESSLRLDWEAVLRQVEP